MLECHEVYMFFMNCILREEICFELLFSCIRRGHALIVVYLRRNCRIARLAWCMAIFVNFLCLVYQFTLSLRAYTLLFSSLLS